MKVLGRFVLLLTILAFPMLAFAQEATVIGTITDATGGVLPGVTVTAVHEASGNTFQAVTDERGGYRLALRVGSVKITAELAGFTTATRTVVLLVGQQAVLDLQMTTAALQESVTVTGEAPLVDTTQSTLGSNVNPRQLSELPVNGRNWMDLTMLTPGSRVNSVSEDPGANGTYEINLDGQQMTQTTGWGFGEPRISRDAIAEFQVLANRFDATQGRSNGLQVNAITKSGTNTPTGTFSGYFRSDKFNAPDFIQKRVLPYSDQQLSATFGGPIIKNKLHYFANYEYERNPSTFTYTTPVPAFNLDQTGTHLEKKGGVRLDYQMSSKTSLTVRGTAFKFALPIDPRYAGGATITPSSAESQDRSTSELLVNLQRVVSNRALNEIKVGVNSIAWTTSSPVVFPNAPADEPVKYGISSPKISLQGLTIGNTHGNTPQHNGQDDLSFRDDFTYSFNAGGRHDVKAGGEFIRQHHYLDSCSNCMGSYDATGGPLPKNLPSIFPNLYDVSTWDLNALNPIIRSYTIGIGNFSTPVPSKEAAAWYQDDWEIRNLTLNLGLRYDIRDNVYGENVAVPPFLTPDRHSQKDRFGPRLGTVYKLNDKTVLRAGIGKFFAEVSDQPTFFTLTSVSQVAPRILNDGRPDFAENPFNGPMPTYSQVLATGLTRSLSSIAAPNAQVPYSWVASAGVQRQLRETMSLTADYVWNGTRHDAFTQNINLAYNSATGVNYPYTDISHLPFPTFGSVSMGFTNKSENYNALQTSFTKRLSNRWEASANYTLSFATDCDPLPYSGFSQVTFPVAPDLGGACSYSAGDQRHRAVFSGILDLGYGFQLSPLYFFGSGLRYSTSYGADLRNLGATSGRLLPDGSILARNAFVGQQVDRVDLRLQRRFKIGGRQAFDAMLETFNLFNHANYGSYTTVVNNAKYGQPSANTDNAYQPRMLQLGFRVTF